MNIGLKIKQRRLLLKLTQEELAARCELTKGYISQLENNLTSPSIQTLNDILESLGLSLKDFFNDEESSKILFKKSDYFEKEYEGYTIKWLVQNSQVNEMEPIIVEILPGRRTDSDNPHEGQEFGYVLEGSVTLCYGSRKIKVNKGETFYYEASKNHYLINEKEEIAKVIWISSPPNF